MVFFLKRLPLFQKKYNEYINVIMERRLYNRLALNILYQLNITKPIIHNT